MSKQFENNSPNFFEDNNNYFEDHHNHSNFSFDVSSNNDLFNVETPNYSDLENEIVNHFQQENQNVEPIINNPHDYKINNVVCCFNTMSTLKLKEISKVCRNSEYNPKKFPALVMRIRNPLCTANMFASGKVSVYGTKKIEDAKLAARKFCKILRKIGYKNLKLKDFRVVNIVAGFDFGFPISLYQLSIDHMNFSRYEPELFNGLIYRMIDPKLVLLIYRSGKVCIAGAKNTDQILKAIDNIKPILENFKKD